MRDTVREQPIMTVETDQATTRRGWEAIVDLALADELLHAQDRLLQRAVYKPTQHQRGLCACDLVDQALQRLLWHREAHEHQQSGAGTLCLSD